MLLYIMLHIGSPSNTLHPHIAGADDGIEQIEGAGMILKCLQTRTGIKFVLT